MSRELPDCHRSRERLERGRKVRKRAAHTHTCCSWSPPLIKTSGWVLTHKQNPCCSWVRFCSFSLWPARVWTEKPTQNLYSVLQILVFSGFYFALGRFSPQRHGSCRILRKVKEVRVPLLLNVRLLLLPMSDAE